MDSTDDLWSAIRRVLPATEELALAVAAELREPPDDILSSVLIGSFALNGRLGSEAAAVEAIEAELARLEPSRGTPRVERLFAADSLDDLLARTQALDAAGSMDLETIVAIQRASGAIAARTDRRMVVVLHRYAVTRRLIWEHCVAATEAGRLDPGQLAAFGRFLLLWNELTSLAVTDGYRIAERDILARAVEARRGALQELLGAVAGDPATKARLRRTALRYGLDPDAGYRLIAIAPRPETDPLPEQPGIGDEELEVLAGRIGHLLGSAAPGAEGVGAGIRLPAVLPLIGRIAVLASDDWAGLKRVPTVLDSVLGGRADAAASRRGRRKDAPTEARQAAWVAVGSEVVDGVVPLAPTYSDLVDATRSAERLGLRGWIPVPEQLALERLLLADRDLADATVRRELGPLLVDDRFGEELIETLQAYFDTGENVTAAARRLHLATRTVAYRLEKIENILGHPLDAQDGRRLSIALMVHRLRSVVDG
ncbi:MAG TPA: helix-turn-helix domain-containing protein [Candidatus Limnocylindrales bacterium]